MMLDLDEVLQPGKSFRIVYKKDHPWNLRVHIRGIIDDEYIVFKTWNYRRQSWVYSVESRYYFELRNDGHLVM